MAPKVTDEYKQSVRESILDAAGTLFARNGYHATSMDDIVKESGLSKGAIYGYFESKEDLFLALSDKELLSVIEDMKAAFMPTDSAKDKLKKAADVHFRHIEGKDAWRVTLESWIQSPRIPTLEARLKKRYDLAHKFIADIVRDGKATGEFKDDVDADATSSVILAAVRGLSMHRNLLAKHSNLQEIKKALLEMIYDGIIAEKSCMCGRR